MTCHIGRKPIQRPVDRRQHAERKHIDFHEPYRLKIVLIPLDDAALGHGGVFDGNDRQAYPGVMTKPPTCCDK